VVHRTVGEVPDPNGEIQTSGIEFIEEPVDGVQAQPDARGCLAEMGEQRRTSSTSTLSGRTILNNQSAVRASNTLSCDTRVVIWARAIRTGSIRAIARGVGRMPSELRVRSSSPNSVRMLVSMNYGFFVFLCAPAGIE
jgi:hypothetical protein